MVFLYRLHTFRANDSLEASKQLQYFNSVVAIPSIPCLSYKTEGLFPYLQNPANGSRTEPDESSPWF